MEVKGVKVEAGKVVITLAADWSPRLMPGGVSKDGKPYPIKLKCLEGFYGATCPVAKVTADGEQFQLFASLDIFGLRPEDVKQKGTANKAVPVQFKL